MMWWFIAFFVTTAIAFRGDDNRWQSNGFDGNDRNFDGDAGIINDPLFGGNLRPVGDNGEDNRRREEDRRHHLVKRWIGEEQGEDAYGYGNDNMGRFVDEWREMEQERRHRHRNQQPDYNFGRHYVKRNVDYKETDRREDGDHHSANEEQFGEGHQPVDVNRPRQEPPQQQQQGIRRPF